MAAHGSDLLLELLHLDEVPPCLAARADGRRAQADTPSALKALAEDDAELLARIPPAFLARTLGQRLKAPAKDRSRPAGGWSRWGVPGSVLALGCLAMGFFAIPPSEMPSASAEARHAAAASSASAIPSVPAVPALAQADGQSRAARMPETVVAQLESPDDGMRTKGGTLRLRIHRIEGSKTAIALRDDDTASPGALLQATLLPGEQSYAALLSIDGKGGVTRHVPEQGDSSVAVREELDAPHSFQLDASPGSERFLLVTSSRPFALREAETVLRHVGERGVPRRAGWSFQSLRIVKPESRP